VPPDQCHARSGSVSGKQSKCAGDRARPSRGATPTVVGTRAPRRHTTGRPHIVRKVDALDEGSSRSAFRPGPVRERPGLPFHTCSGAWLWVTGLSHLPRIFGLKSAKKHTVRTDGSWWKSIATHVHLLLRHGGRIRCRGAAVRRVVAFFFPHSHATHVRCIFYVWVVLTL